MTPGCAVVLPPGTRPTPRFLQATRTSLSRNRDRSRRGARRSDLFAAAATAAGPHLDRSTFDAAMATIHGFPGGFSPILTYGPDKYSGPTEYRVVRLHTNEPPTSHASCPLIRYLRACAGSSSTTGNHCPRRDSQCLTSRTSKRDCGGDPPSSTRSILVLLPMKMPTAWAT